MSTTTSTTKIRSGRAFLWLGVGLFVIGIGLFIVLLNQGYLWNPWYVPALGVLGALAVLLGFCKRRTLIRGIVLILVAMIVYLEIWFVFSYTRLPVYSGPIISNQPFPTFTALRADGSAFTHAQLRGDQDTVLVLFRGLW